MPAHGMFRTIGTGGRDGMPLKRCIVVFLASSVIGTSTGAQGLEWADADAPEAPLDQVYADDPEALEAIYGQFGVENDTYADMTLPELVAAVRQLAPPIDERAADLTPAGELRGEDRAFISWALIWAPRNSSAVMTRENRLGIPTCYVSMEPELQPVREIIETAVAETWERYAAIDFTGWGTCSGARKGIRISFADARPDSKIGVSAEYVDGPSMVLASGFSWNRECRRKQTMCHWSIAVHEFGHAIGFLHEQNQEVVDDWCRRKYPRHVYEANVRAAPLTKYDAQSVMNYCAAIYTRKAGPSDCDIAAAQHLYGIPAGLSYRTSCQLVVQR